MEFKLNKEQVAKYQEWDKKHPSEYIATIGGGTNFIFTPTGLGVVVTVKKIIDGGILTLDLTEDF